MSIARVSFAVKIHSSQGSFRAAKFERSKAGDDNAPKTKQPANASRYVAAVPKWLAFHRCWHCSIVPGGTEVHQEICH